MKGELIGMNIARVNRAENYALPISVVQESVQRILEKRAAAGKEAAGGFLNRLPLLSGAGNGPASIFLVFLPRNNRQHRADYMPGTSAASGTVLGCTVGS